MFTPQGQENSGDSLTKERKLSSACSSRLDNANDISKSSGDLLWLGTSGPVACAENRRCTWCGCSLEAISNTSDGAAFAKRWRPPYHYRNMTRA